MNWRLHTTLSANATYDWFVGSRMAGQPAPLVESNGVSGWLLSRPFRFTTVAGPPPTPTAVAAASTPLSYDDINGTNLTVVSPTQITCTFDLTGAAPGAWHVVVLTTSVREDWG